MKDGKNLLMMEWNRLYFPLLIWIILLFSECLFVYTTNTHYAIQVVIDFCGYIVFFVQALYVVQFRKYREALSKKGKWFVLISPKVDEKDHKEMFPESNCRWCETPNWRLLSMYIIFVG